MSLIYLKLATQTGSACSECHCASQAPVAEDWGYSSDVTLWRSVMCRGFQLELWNQSVSIKCDACEGCVCVCRTGIAEMRKNIFLNEFWFSEIVISWVLSCFLSNHIILFSSSLFLKHFLKKKHYRQKPRFYLFFIYSFLPLRVFFQTSGYLFASVDSFYYQYISLKATSYESERSTSAALLHTHTHTPNFIYNLKFF